MYGHFNRYGGFAEFYGDICEDLNDPVERKLAVLKKKNTAFGGGKGSAPDPNPGYIASADAARDVAKMQTDLGQQNLDFYKQQYAELKPLLQQITQSEVDTANSNQQRANEYADYEKNTYRPLEQQIVQQAKDYDTDAHREQLARTASADVGQAFDSARATQQRQMAALGGAPSPERMAALNQSLLTQEALAKSGAQNQARTNAEQLGYARMMDAAGLGRNLASNASTAYGVSLNANQAAGSSATTGANLMGQGFQTTSGMYGAGANAYGTAGSIYGNEFNSRMQGYQAQQDAAGSMFKGLGSIAGGMLSGGAGSFGGALATKVFGADGGNVPRGLRYADGTHVGAGPVHGKGDGSGIDDQVPAMLSKGEYVLPADTVKQIGAHNLDKLVKKTHTPAAIQRQRKALKGRA